MKEISRRSENAAFPGLERPVRCGGDAHTGSFFLVLALFRVSWRPAEAHAAVSGVVAP